MAIIRDESNAPIEDESSAAINDEGTLALDMSDGFHRHLAGVLDFDFDPGELVVRDTYHRQKAIAVLEPITAKIVVSDGFHKQWVITPIPTTGGGLHDNTEHITYSSHDYLKGRHYGGNVVGTFKSEIVDIGATDAADRHLVYIVGADASETDIVIIGEGTAWNDKLPSPTKWTDAQVSTKTWSQIFDLDEAPSVSMRLYYGGSSPPTSYVDRMEILSAIIPEDNRYFQVSVTISDPNTNVYAYVEKYQLKFCTYP